MGEGLSHFMAPALHQVDGVRRAGDTGAAAGRGAVAGRPGLLLGRRAAGGAGRAAASAGRARKGERPGHAAQHRGADEDLGKPGESENRDATS